MCRRSGDGDLVNLHRRHLRETVEIVGVVSIVASLLLVAWQIRQANRIASAEIQMDLAYAYSDVHINRATTPDFARLFPKLTNPESHLITATEDSQIEGLAWHYINVFWAAQLAYESGLMDRPQFDGYIEDVAWLVAAYPGMHKHLIRIYAAMPPLAGKEIFQPVADLAAKQRAEVSENQ